MKRKRVVLGDDRMTVLCMSGPRHGETMEIPKGTREFYAVDTDATVALQQVDLVPVWRYRMSAGITESGKITFWGARVDAVAETRPGR